MLIPVVDLGFYEKNATAKATGSYKIVLYERTLFPGVGHNLYEYISAFFISILTDLGISPSIGSQLFFLFFVGIYILLFSIIVALRRQMEKNQKMKNKYSYVPKYWIYLQSP